MKKWIQAARLFVITASVLPAILGALLALNRTKSFNLLLFIFTIVGVGLIHTGANLINDYFDHVTGADENNTEAVFPFSGGSRVIQQGSIPPAHVLRAAIICFVAASAIGTYLYIVSGIWVLIFGIIGIVSSILYASPKFSLLNLGVGEIFIGLDFGILTVSGAYYVQTGTIPLSVIMASLPIALIIALILIVNEFPDYTGDKMTGKITMVVRLGKRKSSRVLTALLILTVISVIANAALGFTNLWSLLSLVVLPYIINAAVVSLKHYDNVQDMLPANVAIIKSHMFLNLYLAISCLFIGNFMLVGICLMVLLFIVQLYSMSKSGFNFFERRSSGANT